MRPQHIAAAVGVAVVTAYEVVLGTHDDVGDAVATDVRDRRHRLGAVVEADIDDVGPERLPHGVVDLLAGARQRDCRGVLCGIIAVHVHRCRVGDGRFGVEPHSNLDGGQCGQLDGQADRVVQVEVAVADDDGGDGQRLVALVADLQEPPGVRIDAHRTVIVNVLEDVDRRIGVDPIAGQGDYLLRMNGVVRENGGDGVKRAEDCRRKDDRELPGAGNGDGDRE